MPSQGVAFQVTTKLQQVTMRPLAHQTSSNSPKQRPEFFPSLEGYVATQVCHSQATSPTQLRVLSPHDIE